MKVERYVFNFGIAEAVFGLRVAPLMPVTAETKVRVGSAIALVMGLTIAGSATLTYVQFLQGRDTVTCSGIAAASLVLWIFGALFRRSIRSAHPLACFKSPQYWGIILLTAAGLTFAITTFNRKLKAAPKPVRAAPRELPQAKAPVVFPPLKLQGIIYDGTRSSALIDGQVVHIGEGIGYVLIIGITSNRVTVELQGERRELRLSE